MVEIKRPQTQTIAEVLQTIKDEIAARSDRPFSANEIHLDLMTTPLNSPALGMDVVRMRFNQDIWAAQVSFNVLVRDPVPETARNKALEILDWLLWILDVIPNDKLAIMGGEPIEVDIFNGNEWDAEREEPSDQASYIASFDVWIQLPSPA